MRTIFILLALVGLTFFAACGDDDDDDTASSTPADGTGTGEGTAVNVTLQEFSVIPDTDSGPAGTFDFTIENTGPEDTHEFVVFKTDLDADALPTAEDGSVDEEGEGVELIDEVEDVAVGSTENLSANLEAGKYVFICNIVEEEDDGTTIVHYEQGMRAGFTVE